MMEAQKILDFWYHELTPVQWFKVDPALDQIIKNKFLETLESANRGEIAHWRSSAFGRLAEIIVLDQFPRNIFRGTSLAFAYDNVALVLSQELVLQGLDLKIPVDRLAFAYMPFMHSESALIHIEAMRLFSAKGLEDNYEYEVEHKRIIDLFGRYPHRNAALGRHSTPDELEFLKTHKGF